MKRYTSLVLVTLLGFLLLSADSFAQRGRHYGRPGRGYGRPHYYSYRSYAYNRPFVSLSFGGSPYRYQYGYFYRPYGSVFRISIPPIGIRIATLPPGYRRVYVGPDPYYYYNGTYYRPSPDRRYEVVAPPLGATVDALPPGAKVTVIDGEKYYELGGTYYREDITDDNQLAYTVVGTDGVLNTGDASAPAPAPVGPQVGDRFESLPSEAKAVVIQGEKFYSTPSGLYYKEVLEGNKVYYEVVGK